MLELVLSILEKICIFGILYLIGNFLNYHCKMPPQWRQCYFLLFAFILIMFIFPRDIILLFY